MNSVSFPKSNSLLPVFTLPVFWISVYPIQSWLCYVNSHVCSMLLLCLVSVLTLTVWSALASSNSHQQIWALSLVTDGCLWSYTCQEDTKGYSLSGWAHNRRARLCYMSLTPDGWELRVQWDSLGLHIGHLASEDFLFYYLIWWLNTAVHGSISAFLLSPTQRSFAGAISLLPNHCF